MWKEDQITNVLNLTMKNNSFLKSAAKPWYIKYIISLFLVAVATGLKLSFFYSLGSKTPFLLYFAVIIIVVRFYGKWPAVFACILSTIVINYFFFPPYYSFSIKENDALQLIIFLLECFLLAYTGDSLGKVVNHVAETQRTFKVLIEKSSDGVMMLKLDGHITYSNPAVWKITGYTSEDFKSLDFWAMLVHEEMSYVKEKFYNSASHTDRSIKVQHKIIHKLGHPIWVESTITNLIEEPSVKSMVVSFIDVTERVVRDHQMEDFIGVASHELKTPLTSLKAYTQVLEMRMKKEENVTSAILVNKIDKQINRVVSMIFDLLDVTKLQSGIMHLNKVHFDLNDLISEITDSMQNPGQKHQIITEPGPAVIINGDKDRIGQVLINLLSNGMKYSPDANSIHVFTKIEDNFIVIYVKDNGIGISREEIDKIFDRFYRVGNVKESFQGLGLGLYISSQIVVRHGGRMGVSSEENKGSVFWFSLPL